MLPRCLGELSVSAVFQCQSPPQVSVKRCSRVVSYFKNSPTDLSIADTVKETAMSSENPASHVAQSASAPAIPKKMLLLTIVWVAAVMLVFSRLSDVEDAIGHGPDVIMVASLFFSGCLLLLWVGWIVLFSRWKWMWRIVAGACLVLSPVIAWKVLRPVNGGDATFVRFEPIWISRPEAPLIDDTVASPKVDLVTESDDDFAQFLGPNQNSTLQVDFDISAEQFSDTQAIWQQPIGAGWSGFVARNGYAVTMEQRDDKECVTCYQIETGDLQWIHEYPARHQDNMNLGRTGPRATPTIHDGMVYACGALGHVVCLGGASGEVIWEADLNTILGIELKTDQDADGRSIQYESGLSWGRSGSPLILNDLVIIPGGGAAGGEKTTLLALNRLTGELIWRGGGEMIAYGSPVLATVADVEQILLIAESKAMGFNPENGDVLWDFPRPGESNGAANTSQLSVVSHNRVLTSKGYPDGGGELIELAEEDGKLVPRSVWRNRRALKTKLMSPVFHDGHAYSLSNGFLECARLSDGKRIWKHRGRFGHGQLLLINETILLHSEYGHLYLIQPNHDEYLELGSFPTIDGVCWNTLCLYGEVLLVRSELEAACFRLPVISRKASE